MSIFFTLFLAETVHCQGATPLLLNPEHAALWRRLKKIETLSKKDQKALLHYLDALVKKNEGNGKQRV